MLEAYLPGAEGYCSAFDLSPKQLKAQEDMIDAIICCVCAIRALDGGARPLVGDASSAIWVPLADPVIQARTLLPSSPYSHRAELHRESKDLAVLRRVASEAGLLLPPQLLDPNPFSRRRLDLCRAVAGGARFPHLPEYAAGTGVPCKPSPAKEVERQAMFAAFRAWRAIEDARGGIAGR